MGSSEGIHGVVQRGSTGRLPRTPIPTTQFPQPPGMGESWDPDLVRQAGAVEDYEARFITQTEKYHRQILMLWGPQSDLARDPRWDAVRKSTARTPSSMERWRRPSSKGCRGMIRNTGRQRRCSNIS